MANLCFIFFSLILFHFGAVSCQNLDQYGTCQMIIDCNEKLKEKEMECDSLVANQSTPQPGKNISAFQQCQKQVKDSEMLIKAKENIHRQQVVGCIQKRLAEVDPMDDKKKEHCQKIIEKFQSSTESSNQTVQDITRKQRSADNSEKPAAKEKTQQVKQEAKAKAEQAKKDREEKQKHIQKCNKEFDNLKQKCNSLNDCCSEKGICDLMFEISTLHDELRQAQLDNALKKRECKKLAPVKNVSPNTNAFGTTVEQGKIVQTTPAANTSVISVTIGPEQIPSKGLN